MAKLAQKLKLFLEESDLPVLFAGAGVSARVGIPVWGSYMKQLGVAANEYDQFTKYQIDKALQSNQFGKAASYYFLCDIPEATKFSELVRPLKSYDADPLRSLMALPFRSIVTTNFDRSLFDAYSKETGKAPKEANIDDPTLVGATFDLDFYIARVHGRVEVPKSLRLTDDQLSAISVDPAYIQFLTHIFTRRQVLFVGFSFADPAISAVLRAVREKFSSQHGQKHAALIPENAPESFLRELSAHSIERIVYSPDGGHEELWRAIDTTARELRVADLPKGDARTQPFAVARKYLATSYARMRLGKQLVPMSRAVVEGLVSAIVAKTSSGACEKDIVDAICSELSLDPGLVIELVSQSVAALLRDGLISSVGGDPPKFVGRAVDTSSFDTAIGRLVTGFKDRFRVREARDLDGIEFELVDRFFRNMVLSRGWDLGAAFAARRMPDAFDSKALLDICNESGQVSGRSVSSIARTVDSLLRNPDDDEALILAELGRVAFGLELVLEAPHDALFHRTTLPERIYLDANVLMPSLTKWHPHHDLFSQTISALQDSAGRAAVDVTVCVYDGFLNEIVNHRRLAFEEMLQNEGEGAIWAEREAQIRGTANINVFVGAYLNARMANRELSFETFMQETAPYNNESELRTFLRNRDILVLRESQVATRDMPKILLALEQFFAGQIESRRKNAIVIRHDAFQLAILNRDIEEGRRSVFVTADRLLRVALDKKGFGYLNSATITHLGLAQLIELLVGKVAEPRGLASLLWMSDVSSETERVRNYLLNIALAEHDAALAMVMTDVVDALVEDFGFEMERKDLSLEPAGKEDRASLHASLERVESQFYARMRREVERLAAAEK